MTSEVGRSSCLLPVTVFLVASMGGKYKPGSRPGSYTTRKQKDEQKIQQRIQAAVAAAVAAANLEHQNALDAKDDGLLDDAANKVMENINQDNVKRIDELQNALEAAQHENAKLKETQAKLKHQNSFLCEEAAASNARRFAAEARSEEGCQKLKKIYQKISCKSCWNAYLSTKHTR